MADYVMNTSVNLLGTTSRVATPVVGVKIGDYVFGVYGKAPGFGGTDESQYIINPKYVTSLVVKKINGAVNQYTLKLKYPITPSDDPNLIDKVISSVSTTRKISFSYGDASTPAFAYREEEATITKVRRQTATSSAIKSYTISAISTGMLSTIGAYNFPKRRAKPSDVLYEILYSPKYGLTQVFTGMSDRTLVEQSGLIARNDKVVTLEPKNAISVLDYMNYLVDMMTPSSSSKGMLRDSVYLLVFEDAVSGNFTGPYFKVVQSQHHVEMPTAYEIDIGYPSENIVTDFQIEDDETYSLYYAYASDLQGDVMSKRIADDGSIYNVYSPAWASNSVFFKTTEDMRTWWTKVTEFPIKASITFRGLLRPAVLMSYVRLRITWFGRPDIDSGLYIVQSQQDTIDESGFKTTLSLFRVGGDDSYAY